METQKETYRFQKEFDYEGQHYSMNVVPFIRGSEADKKIYNLQEGQ